MKAEEFGEYLKALRKERNLTIRQLDVYSGVSNSYISQMERGERGIPTPDILKKLSKPLGVTYEKLMEAAGYITKEEIFKNALKEGSFTYDPSELSGKIDERVLNFVKGLIEHPDETLTNMSKDDVDLLADIFMTGESDEVWNHFANKLLLNKGLDPEKTKDIINELENMNEEDIDDVIDFIRYKKSKTDK